MKGKGGEGGGLRVKIVGCSKTRSGSRARVIQNMKKKFSQFLLKGVKLR
jgi:hypothetical protein